MPIHDWTRVDAGLFHDFHQCWSVALSNALNGGVLPPDYFALIEQLTKGSMPDVLTLKLPQGDPKSQTGGLTVADERPRTRVVRRSESQVYAGKANQIVVRHRHGDVVGMVKIVSPGNKGSRNDIRAFLEKTAAIIGQGVHMLVIDLFPPGPRDPHGIHKAIWDEFEEEDFELPADKPLILAS